MPQEFALITVKIDGRFYLALQDAEGGQYLTRSGDTTTKLARAWMSSRIKNRMEVARELGQALHLVHQLQIVLANYPLGLREATEGEEIAVPGYAPALWDRHSAPEYDAILLTVGLNPMHYEYLMKPRYLMSLPTSDSNPQFVYPAFDETFKAWDPKGYERFLTFSKYIRAGLST